jgi:Zn-finger nucleic acid-binding protein
MPLLICPRCGLETYSAARHASVDRCTKCDTPLSDRGRLANLERLTRQALRAVPRHEGLERSAR